MSASQRKSDIAMVISDLGSGGAQRVLLNLATAWTGQGRKVSVVTLSDPAQDFFELPVEVSRLSVGGTRASSSLWGAIKANVMRIAALRRAVRQTGAPVVLGFIAPTNVLLVLATFGLGLRVVVSERNDPARQSFGRIWDMLRTWTYRRADLVTANSHGAIETLSKWIPADRLAYVPNPLRIPENTDTTRRLFVLFVGRLHRQKGVDVLLRAFAASGAALADWRLVIAGEGALEKDLKQMAADLGLGGRIEFLGRVADPVPLYREAGMVVLPSRHEGTPNVLLEAMASGAPCIISDASPGPLECVEDERSGLVVAVEDSQALVRAMERLAASPELRENLGRAARDAVEPHALGNVLPVWDGLLWDMR